MHDEGCVPSVAFFMDFYLYDVYTSTYCYVAQITYTNCDYLAFHLDLYYL